MNNPLRYADPSGNTPTFADEIIMDIVVDEVEEGLEDSETPDPTEFAKILSELVTLKIIMDCDKNGHNTSRQAMEKAALIFDDPEQRKEFQKVWEETFEKTFDEFHTSEAAAERYEEARMEIEGDKNCLMKYASDGLWGVASGLITSPTQQIEILRTVAFIAKEYYNVFIGDEYNAPPPNLDELCRKEESTCSGTFLICILYGLGVLLISMKYKKRRSP